MLMRLVRRGVPSSAAREIHALATAVLPPIAWTSSPLSHLHDERRDVLFDDVFPGYTPQHEWRGARPPSAPVSHFPSPLSLRAVPCTRPTSRDAPPTVRDPIIVRPL